MNKTVLFVLLILCSTDLFCQSKNKLTTKIVTYNLEEILKESKLIPFIDYTPFHYKEHVLNSFQFHPNKCYFFWNEKDDHYLWYRKHGFIRDNSIKKDSPIHSIITSKDSVFFFYLNSKEFHPALNKYFGYIENNKIHYFNSDGVIYNTLDSFAVHEFGSLDKFRDKYIQEVTIEISLGKNNGLFDVENNAQAIDYLRTSYRFYPLYSDNKSVIIRLFVNWVKTVIAISSEQENAIVEALNQKVQINKEDYYNKSKGYKIKSTPFDLKIIKYLFTQKQYSDLCSGLELESARFDKMVYCVQKNNPNPFGDNRMLNDNDRLDSTIDAVFKGY